MKKFLFIINIIFIVTAFSACSVPSMFTQAPEPTITPEPTSEPTPIPTPTPTPTPDPGPYGDGMYVIQSYDNIMPENITEDYQYRKQDDYSAYLHYIVIMEDGLVYPEMDAASEPILEVERGERFELSAELKPDVNADEIWYRIHWSRTEEDEDTGEEIETAYYGYVSGTIADYREFQMDKAYSETLTMAEEINDENSVYVYVMNRNNEHGLPPDTGLRDEFDKVVDAFGMLQDQSAPAYQTQSTDGELRYIPDGEMVKILEIDREWAHVYIPEYEQSYYIPSDYIKYFFSKPGSTIDNLSQSIVIDRKNQNIMYFEVDAVTGNWELLSMSYVSTGTTSEYADPTPLGIFMVQKIRIETPYPSDGRPGIEAGYMPYTIRFSGGAYNHGVPVNNKVDDSGNVTKGRSRESHPSLGVQPESHMCVRNYTTHAKFLYDRVDVGKSIVIVIE